MFVQMRRLVVTEGNAHKVLERFGNKQPQAPSLIEQQPGFIDRQVFVKKVRRGDEEVLVMVRWESEQAWKNWEKSPEHIAGHKAKIGQPKPDFIIESSHTVYEQIV